MSNFLKNWNKFLEEGDYQKELHSPSELARHDRNNLAKKGGAKSSAPFTEDPPKGRAKSAPPGFGGLEETEEAIDEHIVKKDGKYCLMSKKTNKNLGCYDTKAGAEKRERQVQYFKHMGESEVEEDILFEPLTKKQKAHSSKLIRIKYKDKPLDKDGIIDPKVAKAEKESLNEIKMEQVMPRFESKAFLKAVEQRKEDYTKSYGPEHMEMFPPTPEKEKETILTFLPTDIAEKYKPEALNWMISSFIKIAGEGKQMGYGYVRKPLETFYQIKEAGMDRLLSVKDINLIKTPKELNDVVTQAKPAWEEYKQKKAEKDVGAGTNKIYEDDKWEVFIPENKGAACALGKGTEWCTAAPGLDYYKHYHKPEDPLIIFISKEDPSEKYQFNYGTEQFMDKFDSDIRKRSFPEQVYTNTRNLFYKLNEIVKQLSNKLPKGVIKKANEYGSFEELPNGGYKITTEDEINYYDEKGRLHNEDGPANIGYEDGKESVIIWYKHGIIDRDDGPAQIFPLLGIREWLKNGKLHREDGPAYENDKWDKKEWFLDGEHLPYYMWEDEVKKRYSNLQEMIVQELHNLVNEKKDRCYRIAKRKYKAFPSAYACVPESSSKALTREGWKTVEEISIGEEILTFNIHKDELEFKPILNIHRYKDTPTQIVRSGNNGFIFESTSNHKWVVKLPETVSERKNKYNRINDMALIETSDLLENKNNKLLVVSAPYKNENNIIKNKIYKYGDNWIKYLLEASSAQRQTWLFSAIVYDGNQQKVERLTENKQEKEELEWKYDGKNNKQTFGFKQKDIMHRDAFLLSAFLNEGLVTWKKANNKEIYSCHYSSNKRYKNAANLKVVSENTTDVWCPETENNTWVMMQETNGQGIITITGNSGAIVKCRQGKIWKKEK